MNSALAMVPDDELLRRLAEVLRQFRRVEADLIEHVAEVDTRRLYAREGAPSMFAYCTGFLHLSEAEAYLRITVARASRSHPVILALLRDGRLHLTGIALLAPHLTAANEGELLAQSVHKTKRQIEELLATTSPRPDAPALIRRLPGRAALQQTAALQIEAGAPLEPFRAAAPSEAMEPRAAEHPAGSTEMFRELRPDGVVGVAVPIAAPAPAIEPLSTSRYKVQFTASKRLRDKLERLRSLSRAAIPDGDLATLIEVAVTEKIERLEARRFGAVGRPRTTVAASRTAVASGTVAASGTAATSRTAAASRHVPAAVRRAVLLRDGARCGFVGESGRRCSERDRLEYHHRHPWAMGGGHDPKNIGLLCRTHNAWMAEHDYGRRDIDRGESVRGQTKAPFASGAQSGIFSLPG